MYFYIIVLYIYIKNYVYITSPKTNIREKHLFFLQELKLPTYQAHSPQIGMRRYFADLLAVLSNRYQLCPTARHLAVYLLDLFMDHYDVAVRQLYVIALSCLLLASKLKIRLMFVLFILCACKAGVIPFACTCFGSKLI